MQEGSVIDLEDEEMMPPPDMEKFEVEPVEEVEKPAPKMAATKLVPCKTPPTTSPPAVCNKAPGLEVTGGEQTAAERLAELQKQLGPDKLLELLKGPQLNRGNSCGSLASPPLQKALFTPDTAMSSEPSPTATETPLPKASAVSPAPTPPKAAAPAVAKALPPPPVSLQAAAPQVPEGAAEKAAQKAAEGAASPAEGVGEDDDPGAFDISAQDCIHEYGMHEYAGEYTHASLQVESSLYFSSTFLYLSFLFPSFPLLLLSYFALLSFTFPSFSLAFPELINPEKSWDKPIP